MKRFAVVMIVVLSILIVPTVAKETYNIQGKSWIGCIDKEDYETLIGYAVDGDQAAFEQAFFEGLLAGTCTMFEDGEPVYLEDTALFSGLVQLRRPGETKAYWTAMEAIKT